MAFSEAATAGANPEAALGETADPGTVEAEDGGIDGDAPASVELPAFLTDEEPAGAAP